LDVCQGCINRGLLYLNVFFLAFLEKQFFFNQAVDNLVFESCELLFIIRTSLLESPKAEVVGNSSISMIATIRSDFSNLNII